MADAQDYLSIIDEQDSEQKTKLKSSLYSSADASPDAESALQKVSRRSGIPMEALRLDNGTEAKRRLVADESDALLESNPKTANWMSDPERAKVSHDDIDKLAKIENLFGDANKGGSTLAVGGKQDRAAARRAKETAGAILNSVVNLPENFRRFTTEAMGGESESANAVVSGLQSAPASAMQGISESIRIGAEVTGVNPILRMVADATKEKSLSSLVTDVEQDSAFGGFLRKIADLPRNVELSEGRKAADIKTKTETGTLPYYLQGASESIGVSLLAAPYAAMGQLPALGMFAMSATGNQEELTKKGYSEAGAAAVTIPNKLMEGLTEKIGLDAAFQAGKPAAKMMFEFLFKDLLGEEVNTGFNAMSDKLTIKPEMTWGDLGQQMVDTAIITGLQGGMQGAAFHGVATAADKLQDSNAKVANAKLNQVFIESLGKVAQESKLKERLPEAFREFVEESQKDGGIEHVGVPVEQWTTFWQSQNQDPAKIAEEMTGNQDDYIEALATGGDVSIPIGMFVERIAGTSEGQGLFQDVRLRPGDMTAREAEEYSQSGAADEFKASIQKALGEEVNPSEQKVYDDIFGQLLQFRDRTTADREAQLWAARYRARAERTGKDAWELYQRKPVTISKELPNVLKDKLTADPAFDSMLERLRAGDIPSDTQVQGESLVEFLRSKGGIQDVNGELKSRDADKSRKPFQKGLIQDGGLAYDHAAELATEAGYLPERNINALLDAIDSELRGNPVYSTASMNDKAAGERANLDQLKEMLDRSGIDLNGSNQEIRKALEGLSFGQKSNDLQKPQNGVLSDKSSQTGGLQNVGHSTITGRDGRLGKSNTDSFQAVTNVNRGVRDSSQTDVGRIRRAEEQALREYAGQNNLMLDSAPMLEQVDKQVISGTDNKVYAKDGVYYKINTLKHSRTFGNLFTSISLHNLLFPEASYTFEGFTEVDGRLMPVFSQEAIRNEVVDPKELERLGAEALEARGYTRQNNQFTDSIAMAKFVKGDRVVYDINHRNIAVQGGNVFFFDPIIELTDEAKAKVKANPDVLYQSQTFSEGKRGQIQIGNDSISISLLESADFSTFLHETGHAFLEEIKQDGAQLDAPEQIKEDMQTLLDWMGVESVDAIQVDQHEQFARGLEAYFMEGKSPSPELQSVFQRFSAWLKRIYTDVLSLRVNLTPEVRRVMDRLLATDEEIKSAESAHNLGAMFATAKDAGMTEQSFESYKKTAQQAHDEAVERLQQKMMAELSREQKAWWKAEKAKVKEEVEAEAQQDRTYQAYQLLSKGETFTGEKPETPVKLSKTDLVKMYGADYVKNNLKGFRNLYSKEGGIHPDVVAEMFGFSSGDEMVKAFLETPKIGEFIKAETEIRMNERFPGMMEDGSIADEAMQAVLNDKQAQVLAEELRAIRRKEKESRPQVKAALSEAERNAEYERRWLEAEKNLAVAVERGAKQEEIGQLKATIKAEKDAAKADKKAMDAAIPPLEVFKMAAAQAIGAKKVRQLQPQRYLQASEKAGKEAFNAAAKGDFAKAGQAKQQQILNHYLYREAMKAKEEVDKNVTYLNKMTKEPAQKRIGKAGQDFLAQMNAILERYEFISVSLTELDSRESLSNWIKRMQDEGLEPTIEDWLTTGGRSNYKDLTIDELGAVRDAVKNIEALSRQVSIVIADNEEIEKQIAIDELIVDVQDNTGKAKPIPIDKETRTWIEKQGDMLSRFDASLLKAEQFFDWLTGNNINGSWHRFIFRRLAEAQNKENGLSKIYTEKISALFDGLIKENGPGWDGKGLMAKRYFKGIDAPLTKQGAIAVALNIGNESNYNKLLSGREWTDEDAQEILDTLSESDWKFVQSVWDTINELWPEISAMEQRLSGIAPPKVNPREVETPFGTFAGGYYPVVYDSSQSKAGDKQLDSKGEKLFDTNYIRATTEKGHTKARIEEAAYPISLSLEVIPSHMAGVIHDLSFREAILQSNRLINDKDIRQAINEHVGPAYHTMLNRWLASIANDRNIDMTGNEAWARVMSRLRTNATIVAMGFKATTMFSQFAGLSQSLDLVKAKHLTVAMARFMRNPLASTRWVQERSGEMRHRFDNLDRDIRDGIRRNMGKHGPLVAVQRFAFTGIGIADACVSVPTWIGAHDQAIKEGLEGNAVIAFADRAVRLSQGAGSSKDLAAVQRNNEMMKNFTMFYSYFNVLYNRQRDIVRNASTKNIPETLARIFFIIIVPAIMGEILAARGPGDDEEWYTWMMRKTALYPFMSVPFVRDIANSVDQGRVNSFAPVFQGLEKLGKTLIKTSKAIGGDEEWSSVLSDTPDLMGYMLGLPTGQGKITGNFIYDVFTGEYEPKSAISPLRDFFFRREK